MQKKSPERAHPARMEEIRVYKTHWEEIRAMMRLMRLPGVGPVAAKALVEACGSARAAWDASSDFLTAAAGASPAFIEARASAPVLDEGDPEWRFAQDATGGARVQAVSEAGYPRLLLQLPDPPPLLWSRGQDVEEGLPVVAIVGTRRCTSRGRNLAYRWAYELASRGVVIVSGLAAGIDASAHRGALDAGGRTWAVLGTGIDRTYPPEHHELARSILQSGTLLSEWSPGSMARPHQFPRRNRVISGLAHAVIVVEADIKSGALHTARYAMDQGRDLFLVPGRPEDGASSGTNQVLSEGLGTLLFRLPQVWKALDETTMGPKGDERWEGVRQAAAAGRPPVRRSRRQRTEPGSLADRLRTVLADGPQHPEHILGLLSCSREELDLLLLDLESDSRIRTLPGHRVEWIR